MKSRTTASVGIALGLVLTVAGAHVGWACAGCGCSAKPSTEAAAVEVTTPQTTCPVMGGKINKEQYVDVKGYRVYV